MAKVFFVVFDNSERYILTDDDGNSNAYSTEGKALTAAADAARERPGQYYYVMKAVAVAHLPVSNDVETRRL